MFIQEKQSSDIISGNNRLSIILGTAFGSLLGYRIIGLLENPFTEWTQENLISLFKYKNYYGRIIWRFTWCRIGKKIHREKTIFRRFICFSYYSRNFYKPD